MKKLILVTILLMTVLQAVISQKKDEFTLTGHIQGLTGNIIYLTYGKGNSSISDSSVVNQGKFEFRGDLPEATYAQLTTPDERFFQELFIESGRMTIIRKDPAGKIVYSGSRSQTDYQILSKIVADFQARFPPMEKSIDWKSDSAAAIVEWETKANLLRADYYKDIMAFIRQHPSSPVSAYQLAKVYKILKPADLEPLYNGLSQPVKQSFYGQLASQRIKSMQSTVVGSAARDFILPDINTIPVQLSSLRGKYVLIDFWASWCKPCRAENPNVVQVYNKFKETNFQIIGVSLDDRKDKWKEAITQDGLAWINVSDLQGWKSKVIQQYAVSYVPTNFLLNPDGIIIAKDLKGVELDQKLSEVLLNKN